MSEKELTRTVQKVLDANSIAAESRLFFEVPWIADLLTQPGIVLRVPGCRQAKVSTEDSLMSETLKNSRGIASSICFYKEPTAASHDVHEVTSLFAVGDGLNGHPALLHGGVIAMLIDESMGIFKAVNHERSHMLAAETASAGGRLPPNNAPNFTADLQVRYLRPVFTPSHIMVVARHVKKEGRKEWMFVELKQKQPSARNANEESELVTCAIGRALFITARVEKL